jgi:signal transduction histidine kinase/ActR/RegA family two-component response regulator
MSGAAEPPRTSGHFSTWPSWMVLAGGVILAAGIMVSAAIVIVRDRQAEVAEWKTSVTLLSRTLSEHARQTLVASDLLLRGVVARIDALKLADQTDLHERLGGQDIFYLLRNRSADRDQIDVVGIFDAKGNLVNFSRSWPPPLMNVADRDYFRAQLADTGLDMFVGAPVIGRAGGRWTFYVSRKIHDASGRTIGVVNVGLATDFFADFYNRVRGSSEEKIVLFRADGVLMAQVPPHDDGIGQSFADQTIFSEARSAQPGGGALLTRTKWLTAPDDRRLQIVALRQVPDYPMVIAVAVPDTVFLAYWWPLHWRVVIVATITAAAIIAMAAALARMLARQQVMMSALDSARLVAEATTRKKSDFLAVMSHEIRTPINAVVGLSDLLLESPHGGNAHRFVQVISESARHLLHVINSVLDFSRLEAGHVDLQHTPFDLCQTIDAAVAITRGLPDAAAFTITTDIAVDVPALVKGDAGRLNQILLNLLGNAVKFAGSGSVRLLVRRATAGNGGQLRFDVIDAGPGLPLALRERIFEPFVRGPPAAPRTAGQDSIEEPEADQGPTAVNPGGSGLGLAICASLVTRMGGRIGLDETPGGGTTVWFELPLQETLDRLPLERDTGPLSERRKLHMLVVDDTPTNQLVLRALLESLGHSVEVAADGAAALAAVLRQRFDAVFMDVQMPVMDGYEATRQIRFLPQPLATVPVIGVSAFVQPVDHARARAAGMTDYLAKPVRKKELVAILDQVCGVAASPNITTPHRLGPVVD